MTRHDFAVRLQDLLTEAIDTLYPDTELTFQPDRCIATAERMLVPLGDATDQPSEQLFTAGMALLRVAQEHLPED